MDLQHKLLLVSLCLLLRTSLASRPEGEAEALLRWRSTLLSSTSLSLWSLANPTCSWFGVTCDAAGHVTKLHLSNAGLNGTLHTLYSTALQNLTWLDLSSNDLFDAIPANISMFLTLSVLELSTSNFSGAIPGKQPPDQPRICQALTYS
ncbi:hypothetical protein BAE44_0020716 [Dichanthelium oligosanthes]|uniref:Leucine-rich repeat-containing N-terminal plant-type domain-containing protein n=1 Tax=Dichanthelium oligosanthes TaxID=888268 RepID=A0A1E5UZK9_9POAL|nr:hypothetical protein BAE44_0020716 [Dichanthelium oligosanthes]